MSKPIIVAAFLKPFNLKEIFIHYETKEEGKKKCEGSRPQLVPVFFSLYGLQIRK